MTAMTDVGFVRMRISKVVGVRDGDEVCEFVVLDELGGDRQLLISIGQAEAFALAGNLGEVEWGRPMTYQFMAQLVRSLAAGSARSGWTGWSRGPTPPPWKWRGRRAWSWWTRGPATP
jgi:hypothetical protein